MRYDSVMLGPLGIDEYLRLEEASAERHEFVGGRVYALSGTTLRHNHVANNILMRFHALATGTHCRAYTIDIKVRVADDRIYYPDVVVDCATHEQDELVLDAPCIIVEVTSPSSRRIDRGEKLDAYLAMPSLRGYLVVEQHRRHVTMYARSDSNGWTRDEVMSSGSKRVPCLDGELSLDDVYAGVEVPARVREDDDAFAEFMTDGESVF